MPKISGLGLGEIKKVSGLALGDIKKISGLGLGVIWSAVTFIPSGMTKVGTQLTSGTLTLISGWVADTGSTVSSNGVVANGTKLGATIEAQVDWTQHPSIPNEVRLTLRKNGVTIGTESAATTNGMSNVSTTTDVVAGDVLTVWVRDVHTFADYYKATIVAGSTTYLRIT